MMKSKQRRSPRAKFILTPLPHGQTALQVKYRVSEHVVGYYSDFVEMPNHEELPYQQEFRSLPDFLYIQQWQQLRWFFNNLVALHYLEETYPLVVDTDSASTVTLGFRATRATHTAPGTTRARELMLLLKGSTVTFKVFAYTVGTHGMCIEVKYQIHSQEGCPLFDGRFYTTAHHGIFGLEKAFVKGLWEEALREYVGYET